MRRVSLETTNSDRMSITKDTYSTSLRLKGRHENHQGPEMSIGDVLLGLEIQEHLYTFLRGCCGQLMDDDTFSGYPADHVPVASQMWSPEELDLESFSTSMTLTPYRYSASFDSNRLLDLVATKLCSAEHHYHDLREDPAYFEDTMREREQHRQEHLGTLEDKISELEGISQAKTQRKKGKYRPRTPGARARQPSQPDKDEVTVWNRTIKSAVSDALADIGMWGHLRQQLEELHALLHEDDTHIQPGHDLPESLIEPFRMLMYSLQPMCKYVIAKFRFAAHSSPQMRPHSVRTATHILTAPGFLKDKKRYRVWEITNLLYDPKIHDKTGLSVPIDALGHIIQEHSMIKDLFSPYVMVILSELFILAECLREIDFFQPWATMLKNSLCDKRDDLDSRWKERATSWTVSFAKEQHKFAELGEPTGDRFQYPAEKPRTAKSTAAMQKAEANLDAFWSMVEGKIEEALGKPFQDSIWGSLRENHQLRRTPDWTGTAEARRSIAASSVIGRLPKDIYFELEHRTRSPEKKEAETLSRVKYKTRGPATRLADVSSPRLGREIPSAQRIMIQDDDVEVFDALFHTPKSVPPKTIQWKSLTRAMASAGFSFELLYGSVWRFEHPHIKRSIEFHSPHPNSEVTLRRARYYGRLLGRVYGLDRSCFVTIDDTTLRT
jgi:hypothetical protein